MQTILLIGPVKGKSAYDTLAKYQKAFEAQGCEVVNPYHIAMDLGPMLESHYDKEIAQVMLQVDTVVTVDGWQQDRLSIKLIEVAKLFHIPYKFARTYVKEITVARLTTPKPSLWQRCKRLVRAFDERCGWFFTNGSKQTT